MKTFQNTQTLINLADTRLIRNKITYLDGKIQAYRDMLYHLQGLSTNDALEKCEQSLQLMRHNRQLLRRARRGL
jgi:hypothetical protein